MTELIGYSNYITPKLTHQNPLYKKIELYFFKKKHFSWTQKYIFHQMYSFQLLCATTHEFSPVGSTLSSRTIFWNIKSLLLQRTISEEEKYIKTKNYIKKKSIFLKKKRKKNWKTKTSKKNLVWFLHFVATNKRLTRVKFPCDVANLIYISAFSPYRSLPIKSAWSTSNAHNK